jgi:hypothetical protein
MSSSPPTRLEMIAVASNLKTPDNSVLVFPGLVGCAFGLLSSFRKVLAEYEFMIEDSVILRRHKAPVKKFSFGGHPGQHSGGKCPGCADGNSRAKLAARGICGGPLSPFANHVWRSPESAPADRQADKEARRWSRQLGSETQAP